MCGVCGEVTFDGSRADTAAVGRMVDAVVPRGPDADGVWSHEDERVSVHLGHRRLSIIDLSDAGAQPMVDDGLGLTVVFNGCIYNHHQLRAELEGHGYRFFSTSDTEVILKGYHRWGADVVDHLAGCSLSPCTSTTPDGWSWPATGWGSSRCTWPRPRTGCGSPPPCRPCWPAEGSTRSWTPWGCITT